MALRVPNRGWMPPVTNCSPSSGASREVVPTSPPGPAANTMWSRRMVDSHPARICVGHRGSGRRRRGVQREGRTRAQMGLAPGGQYVVPGLSHQRDQLGGAGLVDGLGADVRLGVARAVPVEVVPAGTPTATVVLADRDLGVGGPVRALDVAEGTTQRELPAHVRLGLHEVHALAQGQPVQGAPVPARELTRVVEDAGSLDDPGLALALVV